MTAALFRTKAKLENVVVGTSAGASDAVQYEGFAFGNVFIRSGSITTLTFHVAPDIGEVFVPAYDDTPTTPVAITLTGLTSGRAYPLPVKIAGCGAFKMVGDAGGLVDLSLGS